MTVKDLIEKLKTFPGETPTLYFYDGAPRGAVEVAYLIDENSGPVVILGETEDFKEIITWSEKLP